MSEGHFPQESGRCCSNFSNIDLTIFSNYLNSDRMSVPFKYPGTIIGGNPKRVKFWDQIIH